MNVINNIYLESLKNRFIDIKANKTKIEITIVLMSLNAILIVPFPIMVKWCNNEINKKLPNKIPNAAPSFLKK